MLHYDGGYDRDELTMSILLKLDEFQRSHIYIRLTQHAAEQRVYCCSLAPKQDIRSCSSRN